MLFALSQQAHTYDANGNITAITKGGAAYFSYVYDGMNQLTRENNTAAGFGASFSFDWE